MANFKAYNYNFYDMYRIAGTYSWTKPSDIDESKPILVHVWGAGGAGCDYYYQSIVSHGGGGGGLAVKLIDPSALGAVETIVVGAKNTNSTLQGGTSSFGSHCSATGGNGGVCVIDNAGSNGGTNGSANYRFGGLGIGGDVNRRGGSGGAGYYYSTSDAGGGGGGSAPAPYGYRDGFPGGNASTYAGGGGGGIGGRGNDASYTAGAGGGSMRYSNFSRSRSSYYTPEPGGNGLFGPGGASATARISYISYGGGNARQAQPGRGQFLLSPNEIYLGGGGGAPGGFYTQSTERNQYDATGGGPGGGGGGSGKYSATNGYLNTGDGGMLGGGGGATDYTAQGGAGGNAGGGGGQGYYSYKNAESPGGDGLVIVQYARLL